MALVEGFMWLIFMAIQRAWCAWLGLGVGVGIESGGYLPSATKTTFRVGSSNFNASGCQNCGPFLGP